MGESIGTVYALLGEGIIPATWCAELFVKYLRDLEGYRDAVIKKFDIYTTVYRFIQLKILGKFSILKHWPELIRIYKHMKSEEDRYGMEIKLMNMFKVSRI